jgi:hypothetical protein
MMESRVKLTPEAVPRRNETSSRPGPALVRLNPSTLCSVVCPLSLCADYPGDNPHE